MSLDTEQMHRLVAKGFDALFADNEKKYREMVEKARQYAATCVPEGEKLRLPDIAFAARGAIRIDPMFEAHLIKRKLTQKFWVSWYADYIVEQVYPQPDPAKPQGENGEQHV